MVWAVVNTAIPPRGAMCLSHVAHMTAPFREVSGEGRLLIGRIHHNLVPPFLCQGSGQIQGCMGYTVQCSVLSIEATTWVLKYFGHYISQDITL
jgi:hypothetical protein